jgi:pimeloyl-ACP methyl ester carboxylesterase
MGNRINLSSPACYDNSRPWAEDMQAIITGLALDTPLLVGWSMGGWVVMDYLEHFGDAALAGVGSDRLVHHHRGASAARGRQGAQ